MQFRKILALRGPNLWAYFPVIEAWVDLGPWKDSPSTSIPGFTQRLMAWLPGLIEHHCGIGERGGFLHRLETGTYLAHILEHVTLELQGLAGVEAGFGRARETSEEGVYRVVFKYREETLARECLEAARQLCMAAVEDRPFDVEATVARLRRIAAERLLSDSADAIVQAARRRNIPFFRLEGTDLVQLGYGAKQRRIRGSATDRTGAIAGSIPDDAELLSDLLALAGVPYSSEPGEGKRYRLLVVGGRLAAAAEIGSAPLDVTDHVHPTTAARAADAARVVGLDVAGIDVRCQDIGQPLEIQHGAVTAVVSSPDLQLHESREPEKAIVDLLFEPGDNGRIPVVAVTGANGKTTVTRLIAHILSSAGATVGMTCTDGIYISGRRVTRGDCSGPASARRVLMNPRIEMAVLETARGGILRAGVAFNECQVAVVTNIGEGDHLGISEMHTPRDIAKVKRGIVELVPSYGAAVLNAEDELVADMAQFSAGKVLYFALDPENPLIRERGEGVFVRDGSIVHLAAGGEQVVAPLSAVPMTYGGRVRFQVENALAAVAAAIALGLDAQAIAARLATFVTDLDTDPARFNLFEIRGATVIVDFGHNAPALRAAIDALEAFPHHRRTAVFSSSGDRRDSDIIEMGELLGHAFDRVILYEDNDLYDRPPGAVFQLLREGLAKGARVSAIEEIQGGLPAMKHALDTVQPGDLLLAQAHMADPAAEFLRHYLRRT